MSFVEVKEYKTTNTSLDKSENGEVLAYKIGQQHEYPYILISVKGVENKSEFNVFLKESGYIIKTLKGMVGKEGFMSYLKTPMGDLKLGHLMQSDIALLLNNEIFKDFDICAYLNNNTKIDGNLIYAIV